MTASTIFAVQRPGMRKNSGPLLDLPDANDGIRYAVIRSIAPALCKDRPTEVALVLVTTPRMARFFDEISVSQADAAMTTERLAHFSDTCAAFEFWNASPTEQAAIGIDLAGAPYENRY
ncbi:hypothetical protein [Sphingomonas sp.]|uniref:hypothetical protein n=1 Tax=Sphingomonas sp. TaxID=28214 RepID=UPI002D049542|nr:hypothetical protein [Sphingomonas sp.]HTG39139.1 hypothetical protein [Sphingomonas sp.]